MTVIKQKKEKVNKTRKPTYYGYVRQSIFILTSVEYILLNATGIGSNSWPKVSTLFCYRVSDGRTYRK